MLLTTYSHSVEKPAAELWPYFTNDTCVPTTNPSDPCTLGNYGVYVIMAKTKEHVKAGIDFARQKGLRLIVRNTGHDFLGRSTGWGALVINTHSFQDVTWTNNYNDAGSGSIYKGPAVTIGAGVQGRNILTKGHAQDPPVVVVTGECPVNDHCTFLVLNVCRRTYTNLLHPDGGYRRRLRSRRWPRTLVDPEGFR